MSKSLVKPLSKFDGAKVVYFQITSKFFCNYFSYTLKLFKN